MWASATKLTLIWMVLLSCLDGLFWHGYRLIGNEIPIINKLTLATGSDGTVIDLPFSISRSWDPFTFPLFIMLFFILYEWIYNWGEKNADPTRGFLLGSLFGFASGSIGWIVGAKYGLSWTALTMLASIITVATLIGVLSRSLKLGLASTFGCTLTFCCIIGFGWGFLPAFLFLLVSWSPLWIYLLLKGCWYLITKLWEETDFGETVTEILSGE